MSDPRTVPNDPLEESSEHEIAGVYDCLRRIAADYMRRLSPQQTVQPTEIVHEAYLKIEAGDDVQWRSRTHFVAIASNAIRHLLVDRVRARHAEKRGGGFERVTLSAHVPEERDAEFDLLALDEALQKLACENERRARIVELRIFGGVSGTEIADMCDVSKRTVDRELRIAQAWLLRELSGGDA